MALEFEWDEHNLAHIALHGVTREQVEGALQGFTLFIRDEVRQAEKRKNYVGQASDGRILYIVVTRRQHRFRCVTAFSANRKFQAIYLLTKGAAR